MATTVAKVRAEIEITGMSCDHCVRAVTAALATVPGLAVKKLEVGRAEVLGPGSGAIERAVEAIADAGFEARVKALTTEAARGGCGCCGCGDGPAGG